MQIVKSWPKWDGPEGYYMTSMVMAFIEPDMAQTIDEKNLYRELGKEIGVSYKGNAVDLLYKLVKACRYELLVSEKNAEILREQEHLSAEVARLAREKFVSERQEAFRHLEEVLQNNFLEADAFYDELWHKYFNFEEYGKAKKLSSKHGREKN